MLCPYIQFTIFAVLFSTILPSTFREKCGIVGFVPQYRNIFCHFSVFALSAIEENLAFSAIDAFPMEEISSFLCDRRRALLSSRCGEAFRSEQR